MGSRINVDGSCWEQSHPDYLNVYDVTYWAAEHPGNTAFSADANPIQAFARLEGEASTLLTFPASHSMSRWKDYSKSDYFQLLGKLGALVDFRDLPSSVQTAGTAEEFGATAMHSVGDAEACGSPGEVGNDPALGHRYSMKLFGERNNGLLKKFGEEAALFSDSVTRSALYQPYETRNGKSMVHNNIALFATDQLRQRVAWALSQIVIIGEDGLGKENEHESWLSFYDIFVRHAFGSYCEVIREVSYSPMMATYLSFLQSKSLAHSGSAPDENYAREIMQLFTIGLWELHLDGTQKLDADAEPIPTYDTPHIMTFARVWTGFDLQPWRGNLESPDGLNSQNYVDPLRLRANGILDFHAKERSWRDPFPKMDLYDGHLGDGYPICNQLPDGHFLRVGARYSYLGHSPEPKLQYLKGYTNGPRLSLSSASPLYQRLCGASAGGACHFKSDVVLDENLPCDVDDGTCRVDTLNVVQVTDSQNSNETVYYEYVRVPCVELTFTNATMQRLAQGRVCGQCTFRHTCSDPREAVGGVSCCSSPTSYYTWVPDVQCEYLEESATFATATQRCAARGKYPCYDFRGSDHNNCGYRDGNYMPQWMWQGRTCSGQRIQVDQSGFVTYVGADHSVSDPKLRANSGNLFRARWEGGAYPLASGNCTGVCEVDADTCVCDVAVDGPAAVFTDSGAVPSVQAIEEHLRIGSPHPDMFDAGVYELCASAACLAAGGVTVYTHIASGGAFDEHTIFRIA